MPEQVRLGTFFLEHFNEIGASAPEFLFLFLLILLLQRMETRMMTGPEPVLLDDRFLPRRISE